LGGARYDVMRGVIFVACCGVLGYMDVSHTYHYIRGQSIIKLYVIYNVLEVPLYIFLFISIFASSPNYKHLRMHMWS
jgi:hypothetical protein